MKEAETAKATPWAREALLAKSNSIAFLVETPLKTSWVLYQKQTVISKIIFAVPYCTYVILCIALVRDLFPIL